MFTVNMTSIMYEVEKFNGKNNFSLCQGSMNIQWFTYKGFHNTFPKNIQWLRIVYRSEIKSLIVLEWVELGP